MFEFEEEELKDVSERIQPILLELDTVIQSSSGLWHSLAIIENKLVMLASGAVKFGFNVESQIDQIIILTGAGGTKGITVQEASDLLAIKPKIVHTRFTEEKYKKFFKKITSGRYALSKNGFKRYWDFFNLESQQSSHAIFESEEGVE